MGGGGGWWVGEGVGGWVREWVSWVGVDELGGWVGDVAGVFEGVLESRWRVGGEYDRGC